MDVPAPRASASAAALALALCKSSASSNERDPWERSHDPSSPLPSLESAKAARDCKASAEVIPVLALASCWDVLLQPAGEPPPLRRARPDELQPSHTAGTCPGRSSSRCPRGVRKAPRTQRFPARNVLQPPCPPALPAHTGSQLCRRLCCFQLPSLLDFYLLKN